MTVNAVIYMDHFCIKMIEFSSIPLEANFVSQILHDFAPKTFMLNLSIKVQLSHTQKHTVKMPQDRD